MKRTLLIFAIVLSGPLTLATRDAPPWTVRQRPWNLASQPLSTFELRESLAPGQLVPIDEPSELAQVTSISIALTSAGQAVPHPVTVDLLATLGPARAGPFAKLATSRVKLGAEDRARFAQGGWVDFPLAFDPSSLPASPATLRLQLTSPDSTRLRVVERRHGALGLSGNWGTSAKPATRIEGQLRAPLPDLSGLSFLIDATSVAGTARLELRDPARDSSAPLRSVERWLPAGLRTSWIDFDFKPISEPGEPSSYLRDFSYRLQLPPGSSLRGTAGRPSLRSYHAGTPELTRRASALMGTQPIAGRDLIFRITSSARPDWEAAGPAALLGLALGLAALAVAMCMLVRRPCPAPEEPPR